MDTVVTTKRKSDKRMIRFESPEQIDSIQRAVDLLNATSEVGQRASFNKFVVDSAAREAKRIIQRVLK
ncbi:hypothetical protein LCGC14_2869330 [marine sediment metagenome]|uniref:Uncharacterized protein n=1 Tax=marine sediment metagenome TaxID=412755 RepID=A0A0F9AUM3_9ZZZZ